VTEPARALAWLRMNEGIGDSPLLHTCALAYMADDIPDDAVAAMLAPDKPASTTSLDFAAWFHRPARADGWLLHDFRCQALVNACATVIGEVFDQDGAHVATIGQQVLVR
jgi:acyl-CoA thioesterase-2